MLDHALRNLAPVLDPETYVFVCLDAPVADLGALASIREAEGTTYVIAKSTAIDRGLNGAFTCRRITLTVATDLELVGFIAQIATRLASQGIPCNVVAGYHHDHLFVPEQRAADAMGVLRKLASVAGGSGS